jgi:hypothetical protein
MNYAYLSMACRLIRIEALNTSYKISDSNKITTNGKKYMNRDHFQKKLQRHQTKAAPRHALARAAESVTQLTDNILHELQIHQIELKLQNEEVYLGEKPL